MADTKISALPASTTPLAGTEVLPVVQGGATKQVSVANLTAGRSMSATQLTLSTGSLIIGASGQGIDFSAGSHATGMTSELLDDYEEGTWTATLKGSISDPTTPVTATGLYTKIGRVVYITCAFEAVNTTGASGGVTVIGIPYANDSPDTIACGTVGYIAQMPVINGEVAVNLAVSGSVLAFADFNGIGFGGDLQHSPGGGRYLRFAIMYYAA